MLNYFIETANALGKRLGPVLFQLPPDLRRDDQLLKDFLAQTGGRVRAAFEFRHPSWFDEAVIDQLHASGTALCIAESDQMVSPIRRTAQHVYLRLRKLVYDDDALADWARKIAKLSDDATEIYIFFKHEAAAPMLARKLLTLLGQPCEI